MNPIKKKNTIDLFENIISFDDDKYKKLIKNASIDFNSATTNKDKLKLQIKLLEKLIPVAESVFRDNPDRNSTLAITELINQLNKSIAQVEDTVDFTLIADRIYKEVFNDFIETIVKEIAPIINDTYKLISEDKTQSEADNLKRRMDSLYYKIGILIEDFMLPIRDKILKTILKDV